MEIDDIVGLDVDIDVTIEDDGAALTFKKSWVDVIGNIPNRPGSYYTLNPDISVINFDISNDIDVKVFIQDLENHITLS